MDTFKVGARVMLETDNNGPVHHGEITAINERYATVRWGDGLEQPIPMAQLQPDG